MVRGGSVYAGNPNRRFKVRASSIHGSEYLLWPPLTPVGNGVQVRSAARVNQMVRSPRRTSALSYSGQFVTRYLVLHVGWTFERLDIRSSVQETLIYITGLTKTGRKAIRAPTPCEG